MSIIQPRHLPSAQGVLTSPIPPAAPSGITGAVDWCWFMAPFTLTWSSVSLNQFSAQVDVVTPSITAGGNPKGHFNFDIVSGQPQLIFSDAAGYFRAYYRFWFRSVPAGAWYMFQAGTTEQVIGDPRPAHQRGINVWEDTAAAGFWAGRAGDSPWGADVYYDSHNLDTGLLAGDTQFNLVTSVVSDGNQRQYFSSGLNVNAFDVAPQASVSPAPSGGVSALIVYTEMDF